MSQTKQYLRTEYLAKLNNLDIDKRDKINHELQDLLFEHPKWKKAQVIGTTISMKHEWDTWPIIERAWKENKIIAVPKCHAVDKTMTFHQIESRTDLSVQYYNLLEPIEDKTMKMTKDEIDLLLVPGLIFDQNHYRIGHGGGYYDRFLADFNSETMSLVYREQVIDRIETESFDQSVGELIIADGSL